MPTHPNPGPKGPATPSEPKRIGRPRGTCKPVEQRKRGRSLMLLPADWVTLDELAAECGMSAAEWVSLQVQRARTPEAQP